MPVSGLSPVLRPRGSVHRALEAIPPMGEVRSPRGFSRITSPCPRYARSPHTRVSLPCSSPGNSRQSATFAAVACTEWISRARLSTPPCAFMSKYYWLLLRVWCISGSRCCCRFFVELGALMIVASTMAPWLTLKPVPEDGAIPDRTAACTACCAPAGGWTCGLWFRQVGFRRSGRPPAKRRVEAESDSASSAAIRRRCP